LAICPRCGEDNPERARLCMMCGTGLGLVPLELSEERKIVSVLFVDLVGFTARSHDADPEDVRAALTPYYRALRAEIERLGGTVEKFIGDAVMAVFGVPVAHEDDAHRAVRAALRITDAIAALNQTSSGPDLSIRAAVATGEVLVNLSARPETGESMVAGDVVNTAARLQHEAPVNGVVVGEVTHRSTTDSITYTELEPVIVNGKPDPIPLWKAVATRERAGVDVATRYRTPFVGRDYDLATLKTLFQRTLQESSLQLITVVGEPGVGKSRLLAEFSSSIADLPQPITWRQGRSLPYGDGITFWALGEIIKAQTGIKESDSPDVASGKITDAISALEDDESERAWLQSRLAPLVGADTSDRADQEESFTAWLRFFEAIASTGPLILVFEDLHWADASLLDFISHLAEWSTSVPILVICTARPELLDTHPTWAARSRNVTTISLSPLSDSEIAQLISGLLSRVVLSADILTALLERAGGNPLYAEEFVRMLSDRGLLQQKGRLLGLDTRADIPMPDNLQAVIASRLDSLPSEKKSLLHNAAVVGRVFWSGAVAAMSDRDDDAVRHALQELVHTELVRPARTSSIDGQQEYSFWHALVRDVAYGQIPRPQRAAKHQSAARWIEGIAGEQVADHAEILAHHYEEATKLLTSSGLTEQAAELVEPTIRLLVLAGDRATDLDVERALEHYQRALRLLAPEDSNRPGVLLKLGRALGLSGRVEDAISHFSQALDLFRAAADRRGEAEAGLLLGDFSFFAGLSGGQRRRLTAKSVALLEHVEPGRELAIAYHRSASEAYFAGLPSEAVVWAEKARTIAERVGDHREAILARMWQASAGCDLGVLEGVNELRRLHEETKELGWGEVAGRMCGHLAGALWVIESPTQGLRTYEDGIEWSKRHGLTAPAIHDRAETVWMLYDLGEWNKVLQVGRETTQSSHEQELDAAQLTAMPYMAQVLGWRQQVEEAHRLCERFLLPARQMEDLQTLVPAVAVAAFIAFMGDQPQAAIELIEELQGVTSHSGLWRSRHLPTALRVLVSAGKIEKAVSFAHGVEVTATRDRYCVLTGRAILAEAQGRTEEARELYRQAVERWADYGFVLEEGQAHLGLARCLMALGNGSAATESLHRARAIFSRLGAVSLIQEVDGHLSEAALSGS